MAVWRGDVVRITVKHQIVCRAIQTFVTPLWCADNAMAHNRNVPQQMLRIRHTIDCVQQINFAASILMKMELWLVDAELNVPMEIPTATRAKRTIAMWASFRRTDDCVINVRVKRATLWLRPWWIHVHSTRPRIRNAIRLELMIRPCNVAAPLIRVQSVL